MGNEAPPPSLKMADRGRGRGNGACPRRDWSVRRGVTWAEGSIRAPGRGAAEAPGSGRRGVSAASGQRRDLPDSQRGRSGARAEHGGLPASLRGGLRHRVRAAGAHPAPARPRSSPGAEHLPAARPLSHLEALRPGPGSRPTAGQVRGAGPSPRPAPLLHAREGHARSSLPLKRRGPRGGVGPARLASRLLSPRSAGASRDARFQAGGCRPRCRHLPSACLTVPLPFHVLKRGPRFGFANACHFSLLMILTYLWRFLYSSTKLTPFFAAYSALFQE